MKIILVTMALVAAACGLPSGFTRPTNIQTHLLRPAVEDNGDLMKPAIDVTSQLLRPTVEDNKVDYTADINEIVRPTILTGSANMHDIIRPAPQDVSGSQTSELYSSIDSSLLQIIVNVDGVQQLNSAVQDIPAVETPEVGNFPIIPTEALTRPVVEDISHLLKPTVVDNSNLLRPNIMDKVDLLKPSIIDNGYFLRPTIIDNTEQLRPSLVDNNVFLKPTIVEDGILLKPFIFE